MVFLLKQNLQEKVVTDKGLGFFDGSILYSPSNLLAFDRAVLFQNVVFSILVFSTKKRYSSFEKGFHFSVQVSKMFKIFSDCHIKTCRSLKRRAFLKIPSTDFWKKLCFFKNQLKFCRKSC